MTESPSDIPSTPSAPPAVHRLDGRAWANLGGGAALAAVFLAVPLLRYSLSYLTTILHELGHAVAGWFFGYPSIPAFDFRYGGGFTAHQARVWLILLAVHGLWVGLAVVYRHNRRAVACLAAVAGLHSLCAYTRAHEAVILMMGHGMALFLAGVFLYRALSGSGIVKAIERPLYAMCGLFIVASGVWFGYELWTSPAARAAYEQAKGPGHWMDFTRLAEQYFHVGLKTVAGGFLVACWLTVAGAFAAYRYQDWVFGFLRGLWGRQARRAGAGRA